MKKLVVYSTLTGNTEMVARGINEVVEGEIFPVETAPAADGYDIVFLGFWVDKGHADSEMLKYFECVADKKVVPFYTLGAYPDSQHADNVFADTLKRLEKNDVLGHFRCQGKVDPKLIEMMEKFPEGHPHSMTPERIARLEEASKHPNDDDIANAKKFAEQIMEKFLK